MEIRTLRDQIESDKRFLDGLSDRDRNILRSELSGAKKAAGYRFVESRNQNIRKIK